jgi:hypothetical protein
MRYEAWDVQHVALDTLNWPEADDYAARAEQAWKESLQQKPSVWVFRNRSELERIRGNRAWAKAYYKEAIALGAANLDFAFAVEYLRLLTHEKSYEQAWEFYASLPTSVRNVDRVRLSAAQAAVKLEQNAFLEDVFAREYADIREGECSLNDLWFEYNARRMLRERGQSASDEDRFAMTLDEAYDTLTPPYAIDFRQSYDRKRAYQPR